MSKKVTAVTKSVTLNSGEVVVMGSDGALYRCDRCDKGFVLVDEDTSYEVAVPASDMKLVRRALPALLALVKTKAAMDKASNALEALSDKAEGSGIGKIRFKGDDGGEDEHTEPGIGVGCTFVKLDELPKVLKALGIK